MIDLPQLVRTSPQLVAALHLLVRREEIRQQMTAGLAEIRAALVAQSVTDAGPSLTHHLRPPASTFDFWICIPTVTPITPVGRVVPRTLPATTVARTVYSGPYDGLGQAWGELAQWMESHGHRIGDELWERYLTDPKANADPTNWRTELNRSVTTT